MCCEKLVELKELMGSTNGKLITSKYTDYKSLIEFKCGYCGEISGLTFFELKAAKGYCSNCRYSRMSDKLKHKHEDVFIELESVGVKLLNTYVNSHTNLELKCKCGTVFNRKYSKFKTNGYYCTDCKKSLLQENKLKEYIEFIESNNHTIVNIGAYNGNKTEFEILCSCGESVIRAFREYKKRPMCRTCAKDLAKVNMNLTNEEVSKIISDYSECKLVSLDYVDRNSSLSIECSCGNLFDTFIDRFLVDFKRQCNDCGIARRSGENNPNWRGGVSRDNDKFRSSKEYSKWRSIVFQRDSYICQCCGDNSGGNLQAHHIENFSEKYESRLLLSNGITLCIICHDFRNKESFHHIYGTRENDIHQLQEYFDDTRLLLGLPPIDIIEDIIYKDYIFDIDKNS